MANVLTILNIVPADPNINRDEFVNNYIVADLCSKCEVEFLKYDEEPLAFGVYKIQAYFKTPDSEDGTNKIEKLQEMLEESEDISNVEMNLQTLIDH